MDNDFDPLMPKQMVIQRSQTLSKPKLLDRPTTLSKSNLGSPQTKQEHMARRKDDGLSHRDIAREFGVSKSTSHRTIGKSPPDANTKDSIDD